MATPLLARVGRWGEEYYVFSAFYAFSLSHSVYMSVRALDAGMKFFNYESDMCWKKGKGLRAALNQSTAACDGADFFSFLVLQRVRERLLAQKLLSQQQEIEQLL